MKNIQQNVYAYAYGQPEAEGRIRVCDEDFQVEEILGFEPSGQGEHVFLQIQKKGENTEWIVRQLANLANVKNRDIGYAGLKDRHALTSQWFSVCLPGQQEPDWQVLNTETINVLNVSRNNKKLRRGVLQANRFIIVVRDLINNPPGGSNSIIDRLETIKIHGVPNYFGEQRFGHGGGNIDKAIKLFAGKIRPKKTQRSLYLSAARSFLFNAVLSERITAQNWNQCIDGDVMMLDGSHSIFSLDNKDDEQLQMRLKEGDVHITGPLVGEGEVIVTGACETIETQIIQRHSEIADGLKKERLKQQRRALRVIPKKMQWRFLDDKMLKLEFELPSGSYATSVLRELVNYL